MIDNRLVIIPIVILAGLGLILVANIYSAPAPGGTGALQKTAVSLQDTPTIAINQSIALPEPDHSTAKTLDDVLLNRRSGRQYQNSALTLPQVSKILWAGQGITNKTTGKRTAPSAMATYPLTLYLAAHNITGLPQGVYAYQPAGHSLVMYEDGAGMSALLQAEGQNSALTAPATIFIVANYTPFAQFGNDMALQSTSIEAGHVAQNVLLMATELNLGGVPMTGYNATSVENALSLDKNHHAIYTIAFGVSQ
ncbi:SagB/ThcOx family dehydrogenase [Methanoregula sp.]|uniref:SagB/ThcOx family dehydrogenase n=1 Tax=Methanoregula sp. TaxID=2052170 RepID=UPI003566567F